MDQTIIENGLVVSLLSDIPFAHSRDIHYIHKTSNAIIPAIPLSKLTMPYEKIPHDVKPLTWRVYLVNHGINYGKVGIIDGHISLDILLPKFKGGDPLSSDSLIQTFGAGCDPSRQPAKHSALAAISYDGYVYGWKHGTWYMRQKKYRSDADSK